MRAIRSNEISEEELNDPLFTGPVMRRTVLDGTEGQFNVGYVSFPKGVRNKFHAHTTDQVLIVTKGTRIVATEDQQVELSEGDVVLCPADRKGCHDVDD